MQSSGKHLLVTGATGYIGGRLVTRLLDDGYRVRVLVRDAARLRGRAWSERVEIVQGDVFDTGSLALAMAGVDIAYYLVHSMAGSDHFEQRDIVAAQNFGQASREANVQRIIYLGGLGDPQADLSEHLRSRQQTGAALAEAGVPVIEFRAAVVVGAGSISFEMIRYLTERVPLMVCPRWVFNQIQPIAIHNVLDYLVAALETPMSRGRVIEIGGADVQTYATMMLTYAQERDLKRWLIPVPVLTPRLSSYWVHLVTPISARMARPLIEGLRNEVVVRDHSARQLFPQIQPVDYRTAVQMALANLEAGQVETSWSDALVTSQGDQSIKVLSTHGPDLYRIAALIPPSLRTAFEGGLGDAIGAYYDEVGKQGREPLPQPIPDILDLYLIPGLVSAEEVFAAYQRARIAGHAQLFQDALRERNDRALEVLECMLKGTRPKEAVFIPRKPEDESSGIRGDGLVNQRSPVTP